MSGPGVQGVGDSLKTSTSSAQDVGIKSVAWHLKSTATLLLDAIKHSEA